MRNRALMCLISLLAVTCTPGSTTPKSQGINLAGIIDGATYHLQVPSAWNGTLFLYSHGTVVLGQPNPATDAPGPGDAVPSWLLAHGNAIAGSSFSATGWAVEVALKDQMALLDLFQKRVGKPKQVIAWGQSMGGLISAGLIQLHPGRFSGAIPMCGALAGSVALFNLVLDATYAFRTLLAPAANLQLTNGVNAASELQQANEIYAQALPTPAGQARIALAGALADLPGWFEPARPEPDAANLDAWTGALDLWFSRWLLATAFLGRAVVEKRAGGNPSWNSGVNYHHQLSISPDRGNVLALYSAAGLDLEGDLTRLESGPRIRADPVAVAYMDRNVSLDGKLSVPVLSIHTTGDGEVIPQNEAAYGDTVKAVGKQGLLRQLFIHRAGHCSFTDAETIAVVQSMVERLNKGTWADDALQPNSLNVRAQSLGPRYQTDGAAFAGTPAFVEFEPGPYPRPFSKGAAPPV